MGNCCTKENKPTTQELAKKYNLTETQMREYGDAFRNFDINGDGRISAEELVEVMKQLGYTAITLKMAQDMVASIDKNGINFEEFLFLMSKTTAPGADKSGREQSSLIFQVFDKNKDGRVTKSEIRQTFHTMKVDLTDEQLNEMMAEADKNKDGKIDKAEFKLMYANLMKKRNG